MWYRGWFEIPIIPGENKSGRLLDFGGKRKAARWDYVKTVLAFSRDLVTARYKNVQISFFNNKFIFAGDLLEHFQPEEARWSSQGCLAQGASRGLSFGSRRVLTVILLFFQNLWFSTTLNSKMTFVQRLIFKCESAGVVWTFHNTLFRTFKCRKLSKSKIP